MAPFPCSDVSSRNLGTTYSPTALHDRKCLCGDVLPPRVVWSNIRPNATIFSSSAHPQLRPRSPTVRSSVRRPCTHPSIHLAVSVEKAAPLSLAFGMKAELARSLARSLFPCMLSVAFCPSSICLVTKFLLVVFSHFIPPPLFRPPSVSNSLGFRGMRGAFMRGTE